MQKDSVYLDKPIETSTDPSLKAEQPILSDEQFDSLVHHARLVERYQDPSLKPLSEENFMVFDNSRRQLAKFRALLSTKSGIKV